MLCIERAEERLPQAAAEDINRFMDRQPKDDAAGQVAGLFREFSYLGSPAPVRIGEV